MPERIYLVKEVHVPPYVQTIEAFSTLTAAVDYVEALENKEEHMIHVVYVDRLVKEKQRH